MGLKFIKLFCVGQKSKYLISFLAKMDCNDHPFIIPSASNQDVVSQSVAAMMKIFIVFVHDIISMCTSTKYP